MFRKTRKNREGVQDQLRTIIRRAETVADGLDPDAFNRPPEGGGWSVAECLDHLNETARLYLPEFAEAIAKARSDGRHADPGAPGRTLIGRLIVWTQEPPARFKRDTFDEIRPGSDLERDAVLERFRRLHEEMIVRANEASDLDLRKIKLRSVLDRRLKMSLGDWFHFVAAHARRHLWQAERAREGLGPSADSGPSR